MGIWGAFGERVSVFVWFDRPPIYRRDTRNEVDLWNLCLIGVG